MTSQQSQERFTFVANEQWKPIDTSDVQVKSGSAIDLTPMTALPLVDVPSAAGQRQKRLPRLIIGPRGQLVAQNRPDTPVKLKGFIFHVVDDAAMAVNTFSWFGEGPDWKEGVNRFIRSSRSQGYNLFRVFDIDLMSPKKVLSIEPELLDKVDYLLAQMGQQGIYLHLTLLGYGLFQPEAPSMKYDPQVQCRECDFKAKMFLGDPEMRRIWLYAAETLLNHVNPYTGLAWKDDPAVVCVEPYNEQESGLLARYMKDDESRKLLHQRFREWLRAKYQTPETLADAWADPTLTSFDQITSPAENLAFNPPSYNWTGIGSTPCDQDFTLFVTELARENIAWYVSHLKRIGYTGLIGHYSLSQWWGDHAARYEHSSMAIRNQFFAFTWGYWGGAEGAFCPQHSSVGTLVPHLRGMIGSKFADRPFCMTEYNHCFWNRYQREMGIVHGAYSALQGFDSMVYASTPVVDEAKKLGSFMPGGSPITRPAEFLFTCLFVRGDVKRANHRVELQVPLSILNEFQQASKQQTKLGLISDFALSFPELTPPKEVVKPAEPDVILTPAGDAKVRQRDQWTHADKIVEGDAEKTGASLDALVSQMKRNGILPATNISEPSKGIFQSDTGEITLRAQENLLKVATRFSEAVTMEADRSESVGQLKVINSDTAAMIAVCAMDGHDLAQSRRMILLYITETANTGMVVTPDHSMMFNDGTLPVLMKVGRLDATLDNAHAKNLALYALALNGERRERLPLSTENGRLKIHLDTASLTHGPTPFFELTID